MSYRTSYTRYPQLTDDQHKLRAVFGGVVLLGAAAAITVAIINNGNMRSAIAKIDEGDSLIFTDLAQCAQDHDLQTCGRSQDHALDLANGFGTTLSYRWASTCRRNHGWCDSTYHPSTDSDGNDDSYYTYEPVVAGWQAAANDLDLSVPLYTGPDDSTLVRYDGKKFLKDGTPFQTAPR